MRYVACITVSRVTGLYKQLLTLKFINTWGPKNVNIHGHSEKYMKAQVNIMSHNSYDRKFLSCLVLKINIFLPKIYALFNFHTKEGR